MFSGQGSQYYQMGKEFYQNFESFKKSMDECNDIVSPLIKTSLIEIIYQDRKIGEPFDRLLYTNPALLSIQYSMARVLKDIGVYPDFIIGYSLGEVLATMISGAVALEDGLKLVVDMARIAEEKTPQAKMLAIVADKKIIVNDPSLFSKCWLTASNFSGNFVVGGLPDDINTLQNKLKQERIITQQLPVNQGFHTPLINGLENEFKERIKKLHRYTPEIPIISSWQTDIVDELSDDYFWDIIRYPVNFEKTIEKIIRKGDCIFIDMGPSGSLATSVKYLLPSGSGSVPLQIMNQYGKNLNMLEQFRSSISINV